MVVDEGAVGVAVLLAEGATLAGVGGVPLGDGAALGLGGGLEEGVVGEQGVGGRRS